MMFKNDHKEIKCKYKRTGCVCLTCICSSCRGVAERKNNTCSFCDVRADSVEPLVDLTVTECFAHVDWIKAVMIP